MNKQNKWFGSLCDFTLLTTIINSNRKWITSVDNNNTFHVISPSVCILPI